MKKLILSILAAGVLNATAAIAADMVTKAPMMPPPPANPWDLAFGGGLTSDYVFRGITQSAHNPSVSAYFEPRYNINKDLQLYAGVSGESIDFPNRAAAEIDFYGGIRPTFDKFAFDFGFWEYWYPGGQCFNGSLNPIFGTDCLLNGYLPNGNVGQIYANSVTASPAGSYNYAVSAGNLPPGLTLYSSGLVFGFPTTPGTYNFTITATDAGNCTGSKSYSMVITP